MDSKRVSMTSYEADTDVVAFNLLKLHPPKTEHADTHTAVSVDGVRIKGKDLGAEAYTPQGSSDRTSPVSSSSSHSPRTSTSHLFVERPSVLHAQKHGTEHLK